MQGIPIMPVYSGLDVAEQPGYGAEFPGVYPYTRLGAAETATDQSPLGEPQISRRWESQRAVLW